jgi:hypothetical protein
MFHYWHLYTITAVNGRRRFVQGRLADLTQDPPTLIPEPRARVLYDPNAAAGAPNRASHSAKPGIAS